ncbi:FAD-binding oxidoreductase [Sphingomonas lycopersici]|uniref:FAD-binding oxidoreductase n=1 Tax=Sphingomonas lycopersici TaxID=2951807 RepID=A0AA42CQX0_9SPHN|nr:FAD-binding oxidoreductase [Sphingomonas lycopersici]MCW6532472.1 FAD-binding oxidoreductase [Sphingomonas lycopersici]MCW6536120.1 FAD-binding oxidoreductase [Sphingomonas lycopersici]
MTPDQIRLVDALAGHLPARVIVTDPAEIAPWETDWRGRWHGHAALLLAPTSTAEVAAIVAAAAAHRVPLVPQGGNTSMVGGATPPADGGAAILSLRRMNAIRSLDAEAGLAVVEAGVILAELHAVAATVGMRFPLSLGAKGSATIGGLVSTNAGGTQVLRFGTMRGLVAGLEAVLPDGQIHDGLAALKKDNRGYDLTQLLIGGEGTLGVVTAATVRLVPAVAARTVAWVGLADPAAALTLLRRFQRASEGVESFELLPAESLDAVLRHIPGTRAPLSGAHPWHALIEVTAAHDAREAPAAIVEHMLGAALADGLVADATIAASEAQADAFWRIRESISEAERATGPAAQHDISVPIEAMPRFMIEAAAACEARFPGTRASGFGHLGDGNVHFHVRAPAGADRTRWLAQEAPVVTQFVDDLVVAAGGSISAEHGIGQMKLGELERLSSPARMSALRAIKAALDPHNIMNPGKLVALAPRGPAE